MFGDTVLAFAVILMLHGLYRLARLSLIAARGTPPPHSPSCRPPRPPRPGWSRMMLQPHRVDRPGTASRPPPVVGDAERVPGLESALARRDAEIEALRRQVSALRAPIPDHDGDVADPFDPVPGRDDLRAIQGIGKRMQRLLNGMGVTTFAQLAAFERSHIERVASQLVGERDDIEAENWVGQARALLARRRRTHEQG